MFATTRFSVLKIARALSSYVEVLAIRRSTLLALLAVLLISNGCQTLSLPAIDPTGNRIFTTGSTTLINPHDPNNGYPSNNPAFQTPPEPPRCVQGGEKKLCQGCLTGKGCLFGKKQLEEQRGRCGQLLITPNRIMAPVGGEVIILAGVCGKDEYLVTNEPIEWMLSPDSVGQIVEVGDDAKGQRQSRWKTSTDPKVEKLDVDFARGRTSREAGVITKGTASRADDLPIRKGQTWISLTSPSEGTSKVTVLAPDSDVWDKRRQTATIYWVDASWDFPQPQMLVGDEPATLVTKVMKSDGIVAARGWKVKYTSLQPEFARFVLRNANNPNDELYKDSVTELVNEQGVAYSLMRRMATNANGVSQPRNGTVFVEVEVIRPESPELRLPDLTLARGTTSVTWSAPELVLDAYGPDVATPGQSLQYFVRVSNIGDLVAENVIVTASIPQGMRFDGSSYQPQRQTNNALVWELGPLDARRRFEVSINLTPIDAADTRLTVDLISSNGPAQQKIVSTFIQKPQLVLQLTPSPNSLQVPLNGTAEFDVLLTNTGNQTINNIQVSIASDTGLVHASSGDTRVVQDVPVIRPGERIPLQAKFRVLREGDLQVNATATVGGQVLAGQRSSIRGIGNANNPAPPPARSALKLDLVATPPQRLLAPQSPVTIQCILSNLGSGPLLAPSVSVVHDPSFTVQSLDPNTTYQQDQRLIVWNLRDIPAQERPLVMSLVLVPNGPAREASVRAEARTTDGVVDGKQLTFEIGQGTGVPSGNGGGAVMPPPPGGLPSTNPGLPAPALPSTNLPGVGQPGTGLPGLNLPSGTPGLPPASNAPLLPTSSSKPAANAAHSNASVPRSNPDRLSLTIQPLTDIVKRGEVVTYEMRVDSTSAQADQKVALQFTLPKGTKLVSVRALGLDYRLADDGQTVEMTPIQYFRPKDSFVYSIQLRHDVPGSQTLSAMVRSRSQTEPIGATFVTKVQ